MDIIKLEDYYKIKIPMQPYFYDPQWDEYLKIAGVNCMVNLKKHMKLQKHTCHTPYTYMMLLTEFNMYWTGKTYYDASSDLRIPTSTSFDHFKTFKLHHPRY